MFCDHPSAGGCLNHYVGGNQGHHPPLTSHYHTPGSRGSRGSREIRIGCWVAVSPNIARGAGEKRGIRIGGWAARIPQFPVGSKGSLGIRIDGWAAGISQNRAAGADGAGGLG